MHKLNNNLPTCSCLVLDIPFSLYLTSPSRWPPFTLQTLLGFYCISLCHSAAQIFCHLLPKFANFHQEFRLQGLRFQISPQWVRPQAVRRTASTQTLHVPIMCMYFHDLRCGLWDSIFLDLRTKLDSKLLDFQAGGSL